MTPTIIINTPYASKRICLLSFLFPFILFYLLPGSVRCSSVESMFVAPSGIDVRSAAARTVPKGTATKATEESSRTIIVIITSRKNVLLFYYIGIHATRFTCLFLFILKSHLENLMPTSLVSMERLKKLYGSRE